MQFIMMQSDKDGCEVKHINDEIGKNYKVII